MKVKLVSVCMIVAAMALAQAVDTTAKKSVRDMTPEERAAYRAKMQENMKKPVKKSKWQLKMEELQKQQAQMIKQQQQAQKRK